MAATRRKPKRSIVLPPVLGSDEYGRALKRLRLKVGAANLSELSERAIAAYAQQHGIEMPARVNPHGTNRFGKPGEKSPEDT
jgi:hypothetical protein